MILFIRRQDVSAFSVFLILNHYRLTERQQSNRRMHTNTSSPFVWLWRTFIRTNTAIVVRNFFSYARELWNVENGKCAKHHNLTSLLRSILFPNRIMWKFCIVRIFHRHTIMYNLHYTYHVALYSFSGTRNSNQDDKQHTQCHSLCGSANIIAALNL